MLYVMGSPEADGPRHRQLAADLGCRIISIDYRLAPETMFPGAIEDRFVALAWVFGSADALGIDRARRVAQGLCPHPQRILVRIADMLLFPIWAAAG